MQFRTPFAFRHPRTSSVRPARGDLVVACAAVFLALLLPWRLTDAADEVPASDASESVVLSVGAVEFPGGLDSEEPEPDFCVEAFAFSREGCVALVPSDRTGDVITEAERRDVAEALFTACVSDSGTVLGDALLSGALAGVEFEWACQGGAATPGAHGFAAVAYVYALGAEGAPRLVATAYGYDTKLLALRMDDLESATGQSLECQTIFTCPSAGGAADGDP